ncbi:MAG TPA: SDR family NAD(P)-dependent oxidoreductase [Gammaproteobacteria bacterium]|nr:SDR family NAD(P)-dependent oxidoreductase [Gammaproteobacteria bacterium]
MKTLDRRRFIEGGTLLALAPYLGKAFAQDVPRSHFAASATAEDVTAGIDMTGKTVVVTGCNSGIGLETMRVLALRGAHVIGTARTLERGQEACASVKGNATPVVLELSEFKSVVACAERIRALNVPIDVLICNAGMLLFDLQQVNGLEIQFVVNHLGHFILTNRLLDRVTAAPQGRVVVVGSVAHRQAPAGGIQFDNLSGRGWERQAYAHSKLANGLFSLELSKRLAGTTATSNSLHPGVVQTNIMRNLNFPPPAASGGGGGAPRRGGGGGGFGFESPAQGAATSCYLASNPALKGVTGQYFADCNPAEQSDYQKDPAMAVKLWQVSEELTRPYLS